MQKLKDKKILIIDRSAIIMNRIKAEFEKNSASVKCYDSSDTGLLEIIRWHPDLIITSIEVGKITGFDLCLILKLMADYAAIPIILISSDQDDFLKKHAEDVGADFYITKNKDIFSNMQNAINKLFKPAEKKSVKIPTIKIKSGKVLVIDDSMVIRRIIKNILQSLNITNLIEAEHGSQGLTALKNNEISLVLTDWNMPQMDGITFIRKVRSQKKYNNIPIIMVTTESATEERNVALNEGACALISKPFTREKVAEVINKYLSNNSSCSN